MSKKNRKIAELEGKVDDLQRQLKEFRNNNIELTKQQESLLREAIKHTARSAVEFFNKVDSFTGAVDVNFCSAPDEIRTIFTVQEHQTLDSKL